MAGFGLNRRASLMGCAAVVALSAAALSQPAFAQDADDGSTVLPEVVITAERRVQNLQDVAIAATVLNADQLAERGVAQIADVQRIAPSVTVNTYNRSTFINIRGIGIAQSAPTSTPGVAYYLNGGLIPHEQTIGMAFYDLESIQILRGPQGTLTGQNSTGGAVYITTPKPVIGELFGYVDQTLTDYAGSRSVGAVNVPVSDSLALRLAGVLDKRDSFTTNTGGVSQPGNVNVGAIRADLLFQPSDDLKVNFRYEKFRNHTDYNAIKRRGDVVSLDPFSIQEDGRSNFLQDGYRAEIEARWDLNEAVQLRTDLNYQYGYNEDIADGDRTDTATTAPVSPSSARGRLGYARTVFNTKVAEVNLISMSEGPLQWVAGAFILNEKVPVQLATYFDRVVPTTTPTPTITEATNLSRSLFGQASYEFNDAWKLEVGARYSADKQIYDRLSPVPYTQDSTTSGVATGRVALNWQFNDRTLFYASVAKGYKAGGVNLVAGDPAFEPETNIVEEIGFKTTVLDGRLRINGAVFNSQYEGLQLSSLSGGLPSTRNVPESISKGAELEFLGAFGDLQINGGVAYLKSETDVAANLTNNTGINPPGWTVVSGPLLTVPAGSGLPFAPEWTVNAGVQYDIRLGEATLTPRVQVSYQSDQYGSIFPNANSLVPQRTLLDARLTYNSGGSWRAEAFVNNLTDETYVAAQVFNSSSSNGGIIYGAPRVYGARLVLNFD